MQEDSSPDADIRRQGSPRPLEYVKLNPLWSYSFLPEAPRALQESQAEGLSCSSEETDQAGALAFFYLYQPVARSPLFQFGRGRRDSSSNSERGVGPPAS